MRRGLPALVLIITACFLVPIEAVSAQDGWSVRSFIDRLLSGGSPEVADPAEDAPGAVRRASPPLREVPASREAMQLSFAPLVEDTASAVVNVYAARIVPAMRSPFAGDPFFGQFFGERSPPRRMQSALGSGVVVDPSGLVVTNNHVIAEADEIRVAFADGREYASELVLRDERVDLAVLRIDAEGGTFPVLPIGNSDDLMIGDLVLAIGNPFGIGQTVTSGIVSALSRSYAGIQDFGFFIQTDAAINPGNSGGALVSLDGHLAGINTAIFSRSGGSNGIGFAIPADMVARFVESARRGEPFRRPYLGASFVPVTADIAEAVGLDRPLGALVSRLVEGAPGDVAGLQVGDLVLEVDGFAITSPQALDFRLATMAPGSVARLSGERNGEPFTLSLSIEPAPEDPPRDEKRISGRNPFAGATVANASPALAEELGLPMETRGVIVVAVERASLASRFGLEVGDLVRSLNGQAPRTSADFVEMLERFPRGWQIELERDGRRFVRSIR